LGQVQNAPRIGAADGKGFFIIDMLASFQRGQRNFRVGCWNSQVDDKLNLRVGKQVFDTVGAWHFKLSGARLCPLKQYVGAGQRPQNLQLFGGLQIDAADGATANDADFDGLDGLGGADGKGEGCWTN